MFSLTASARGVGGGNFSEREFVESRLVQKIFFNFVGVFRVAPNLHDIFNFFLRLVLSSYGRVYSL